MTPAQPQTGRTDSKPVSIRAIQRSGEIQFESQELPVLARTKATLALGYRRSFDFDPKDQPGQDDAGLRGDGRHVVGVLADGVGQSFYGDVAAKAVVDSLLEKLWSCRDKPPSSEQLEDHLKELSAEIAPKVNNIQRSPTQPKMLQDALEIARVKGTRAVFGAFALDLESNIAHVYMVGDVCALVQKAGGEIEQQLAEPSGRWSSNQEYSKLQMKYFTLEQPKFILLKSDGASPDWGLKLPTCEATKEDFSAMIKSHGAEDDVSFIAVCVTNLSAPQGTSKPVPTPNAPPESNNKKKAPDSSRKRQKKRTRGGAISAVLRFVVFVGVFVSGFTASLFPPGEALRQALAPKIQEVIELLTSRPSPGEGTSPKALPAEAERGQRRRLGRALYLRPLDDLATALPHPEVMSHRFEQNLVIVCPGSPPLLPPGPVFAPQNQGVQKLTIECNAGVEQVGSTSGARELQLLIDQAASSESPVEKIIRLDEGWRPWQEPIAGWAVEMNGVFEHP